MNIMMMVVMAMIATSPLFGQQVIMHSDVVQTLVKNHLVMGTALRTIEHESDQVRTYKDSLALAWTVTSAIVHAQYQRLSAIPDLLVKGEHLKEIGKLSSDILALERKLLAAANQNMACYQHIVQLHGKIAERLVALGLRIEQQVLQGGAENLLSYAQRLEITTVVLTELRIIKKHLSGLAIRLQLLKKYSSMPILPPPY